MLKIGTFSKLSRLSIRMLRRYDELGLLQPVHTDPFIGYFRNLYIFGQPAEFVSVVTKIASGVTLVNSLLSTVCAVVLYIALRPALEKAHLLPKE